MFKETNETKLQSYINEINKIQNADLSKLNPDKQELYQSMQLKQYANVLEDVEASQAALLLSTQGLSNAQIQQTLAAKGLTTTQQLEAMTSAGLLKTKKSLTNEELQSSIAKVLSKEMSEESAKAKAQELMQSMGLAVAIEGEEAQTVELTSKKLAELATSKELNEELAEEIALRNGVSLSMNKQNTSSVPQFITNLKASAKATKTLALETIKWLATNPATWCLVATAALYGLSKIIDKNTKSLKEQKELLEETKNSISEYDSEISEKEGKRTENQQKIDELKGSNNDVDIHTRLELENENNLLTQQIEIIKTLQSEEKKLAQQTTMDILNNTAKIVRMSETLEKLKSFDIMGALKSSDSGAGAFVNSIDEFKEGDIWGGIKKIGKGMLTGNSLAANLTNLLFPQKENDKSILEETEEQIPKVQDLNEKLAILERERAWLSKDDYEKKRAKITKQYEAESTSLSENIKQLQSYQATLDTTDPIQSQKYEEIQTTLDNYIKSMAYSSDYDTFDEIINSSAFGAPKEELIELAKQGELTEEVMQDKFRNLWLLFGELGLSIDDIIAKLAQMSETGIENTDKTKTISFNQAFAKIEPDKELTSELFDLATAGKLSGDKLKELAKDNDLLKSAMDSSGLSAETFANKLEMLNIENIEKDINHFTDALEKVKNGQSLTVEETAELIEKDNSLAGAVKKTKDGYLLEKDALKTLIDTHKEKYNVAVSYEINETTKTIEQVKKRIKGYEEEISALQAVMEARNMEYLSITNGGTTEDADDVSRALFGNSQAMQDYTKLQQQIKKSEKDKKKLKKLQKQLKELRNSLKNSGDGGKDKGSGSKDKTKKDSSEVIDWIEKRLSRLSERIDTTKAKLENLFNFNKRQNNLEKQIKQATKLMNAYGKATKRYQEKANSVDLSESLKKKVRNGAISSKKGGYKKNIKKYGEDTANAIKDYEEWYNKYLEARSNKIAQKTAIRELKEQKYQETVDKENAKIDLYEQQKENATTAKSKNDYLDKEIHHYKTSYAYQIKIAGLTNNTTEQSRLQEELNTKLRDIEIEKLKNTEAEQQATLDLYGAEKENLKTATEKNAKVDQELQTTRELFATQIAIAKLQHGEDSDEVKKLEEELERTEVEKQKEKFDNIANYYDNLRRLNANAYQDLENASSELEAKGLIVGESLYNSQIALNNEKVKGYREELPLLEAQLAHIEKGTDEWYDAVDAIQECENAIADATANTLELQKAIREIPFLVNDKIAARLDLISAEFEMVRTLMSNKKLVDDGTFTDEGTATLASYYAQWQLISEEVGNLKDEIDQLDADIANGKYDDEASAIEYRNDKYQEYIDLIGSEYDTQQELINMMKDKYQAELDYLQELIDKRKELLQAQKDAYDYQRTMEEKTSTVSTLQKQLQALQGDDSEGAALKRQQLLVSLDDARQDLQDTEYDRWISDQQEMLDKLYNEYADFMDEHMNDTDALLQEAIDYLSSDEAEETFKTTMEEYGKKYGFDPESDFDSILTALGEGGSIVTAINSVADRITGYYDKQQADTNAANEVIKSISEIGDVSTEEGRARLLNTVAAYDRLSDDQKAIVNATSVNGLATLQQKQAEDDAIMQNKRQQALNDVLKSELEGYIRQTFLADRNTYATDKGNEAQEGIRQILEARGLGRVDDVDYKYLNGNAVQEIVKRINNSGRGVNVPANAPGLLQYMRNIGFSQGGVADILTKVPGMNGDDGWITVKKGEGILTPAQTQEFQKLVQNLDLLNGVVNIAGNLAKPNLSTLPNRNITQTMGDVHIDMSFPSVTNYEEFRHKMQSDPKIEQMFRSMIWDKGDFSKYKINM